MAVSAQEYDIIQQILDIRRTGVHVHRHHCDQHQYRAEEGVQKEFERGINPVFAAPNPHDQEHRDQTGFEEDVE